MEEVFLRYLSLLESLRKALEQLTELNQEKAEIVRKKDLVALDKCMQREQAMSMQLRSLEQKRGKLVAELGLQGTSLSGLADRCPESLRPQTRKTAAALKNQYELYQSAAGMARTRLERTLHQIQRITKGAENDITPPSSLTDVRV